MVLPADPECLGPVLVIIGCSLAKYHEQERFVKWSHLGELRLHLFALLPDSIFCSFTNLLWCSKTDKNWQDEKSCSEGCKSRHFAFVNQIQFGPSYFCCTGDSF